MAVYRLEGARAAAWTDVMTWMKRSRIKWCCRWSRDQLPQSQWRKGRMLRIPQIRYLWQCEHLHKEAWIPSLRCDSFSSSRRNWGSIGPRQTFSHKSKIGFNEEGWLIKRWWTKPPRRSVGMMFSYGYCKLNLFSLYSCGPLKYLSVIVCGLSAAPSGNAALVTSPIMLRVALSS